MPKPAITINGVALSDPQTTTVRVALESFAATLTTKGLGDDDSGRILTAAYLARIREIRPMMYGALSGEAGEHPTKEPLP